MNVEVVATGEQNLILPPDHKLIRNGRVLATMKRVKGIFSPQ